MVHTAGCGKLDNRPIFIQPAGLDLDAPEFAIGILDVRVPICSIRSFHSIDWFNLKLLM